MVKVHRKTCRSRPCTRRAGDSRQDETGGHTGELPLDHGKDFIGVEVDDGALESGRHPGTARDPGDPA
ncbi:hypothetical protein GCM10010289_74400 [Streptomyces violascens]|nr:hypothetical protein GCM10010289_74400 [Streptomyces violascens]